MQKKMVSSRPTGRDGDPSKHQRRVKAKIALRTAGYEAVPQALRGGFKRPGSQNLHHQ